MAPPLQPVAGREVRDRLNRRCRRHEVRASQLGLRRLIEEQIVAPLAIRLAGDPTLRDRSVGVVTADEATRAPADQLVIALPK